MLDRIDVFLDDHPRFYLLAAALFVYAGYMYISDAEQMVTRYVQAREISREVSEALGG